MSLVPYLFPLYLDTTQHYGCDSEESYDPGEPPAATTEAPAKKDEEMYDLGVFDEDPEELQKRAVALMKQRDLRTSLKSREVPGGVS